MRRLIAFLVCVCLLCVPVQGAGGDKYIALTFDDGPSGRFTRRLLEGLEERDVKATFLLCGYRIKDYPDTARQIFDAGHEIGLHGYSHKNMAAMSMGELKKELADTAALLPECCEPAFLRPPGGKVTESVKKAAADAGLAVLNWSVDPRDWANHDAAAVETAVVAAVQDGDVILLHDMCDCSVDAALAIVDTLLAQGFRFVTVSELARIRGCDVIPGELYCYFRG